MKNIYLLFIIAIILLNSCKTTQETVEITKTVVKDSIIYKTNTIIKDSIITILLPRDTVFIHKYIKSNGGSIKDIDTIIVEKGIVGAKAWIVKSNLGVIAYVSDSSLFYKFDSARILITKYKELYEIERTNSKKSQAIIKTKNGKFANFTIWFFWFVIAVLIVGIVIKLKQ